MFHNVSCFGRANFFKKVVLEAQQLRKLLYFKKSVTKKKVIFQKVLFNI